jgi:hypothetical protein
VNKLLLDGVRAIKNRLKCQGNKGRKKRRGRPSKKAQKQKQYRQGMSKKEQAALLWEHQHLIVRKQEDRSKQEKQNLALMLKIAPALTLFRQCNQQFYRLFEKGMTRRVRAHAAHAWSTILCTKPMPFWPKHSRRLVKTSLTR